MPDQPTLLKLATWNGRLALICAAAALGVLGYSAIDHERAALLIQGPTLVNRIEPLALPLPLSPIWDSARTGPLGAAELVPMGTIDQIRSPIDVLRTSVQELPSGVLNGFQRGKDAAAFASLDDIAAWAEIASEGEPARRATLNEVAENCFGDSLRIGAAITLRAWPEDLIRELQGFESGFEGKVKPAEALRLAAATNVYGTIHEEAVALETELGPMLVCRWAWPSGANQSRALPLQLLSLNERGSNSILITLAGTSVPLAGINDRGVSIFRAGPEDRLDNYASAIGPDSVALIRDLLASAHSAGMDEPQPSQSAVGRAVLRLAQGSEHQINRHATPGIWLCADPHEAWRYEWIAAGNDQERSGELEFEALQPGSQVVASGQYRAPELAGKGASWAKIDPAILETEAAQYRGSVASLGQLSRLLTQRDGDFRVALWPRGRSVVIWRDSRLVSVTCGSLVR